VRFHFIGVCGTAMATLAAMLKTKGHVVQGSDHGMYPPMSDFLVREGIRVFDGYDPGHITPDIDVVVVGNAVSRGNPELEEVLDRKVRYLSLPETIREQFLWNARSVVIAGTHGKTTTTALAGWLLTAGGRDPGVLIGGIAGNFDGSFRLGAGREFVIEGDEYDSAFFDKTAKFLKYLPDIAVIGNLEYDHADIYPDLESLRVAFRRLINLVPRNGRLLIGFDSDEARRLAEHARSPAETFGMSPDADWHATEIQPAGDATRFEVTHGGERLGHFTLPLYGVHNVRNALAALAIGHAVGVPVDAMRDALARFKGVRRRLELRGVARGVSVYDDFAHHPTATLETLRAIRSTHPDRRVWAVFEPRSATSCRRVFQQDFARAFIDSRADEIVLANVFRSSLPESERLSVDELVSDIQRAGLHARHIPTTDGIVNVIAGEARDGDLVVIMSNGGFDGIHDKLLTMLGAADAVRRGGDEGQKHVRANPPEQGRDVV
jgi:UDP-N-acetylmuramate: L-alanyl-gamma-D-glutamyl-meso-diaminopimelate ligase